MGMITRIRGRLHTTHKPDQKRNDEKMAETVCLLSVLLLLPYCSRGHAPLLLSLGGWCLLTYSCLVLPVLVSANYRYPTRWLRSVFAAAPGMLRRVSGPLMMVYRPLDRCERAFLQMSNLSNLAAQVSVFLVCDRVLLPAGASSSFSGLYALMFCNVVAYCVGYVRDVAAMGAWSPLVAVSAHSRVTHVAMSAIRIVLEWTKAVAFGVTVAFALLVFSLDAPPPPTASPLYALATCTFYMCTERVFADLAPAALRCLRLRRLEALEHVYAPFALRCYSITLATLLCAAAAAAAVDQWRLAAVAFYLSGVLRAKDTLRHTWRHLRHEAALLGRFRRALPHEIADVGDDVCAVCLTRMLAARVTPCHHLFHAECLRACVATSQRCPMCKRDYVFVH